MQLPTRLPNCNTSTKSRFWRANGYSQTCLVVAYGRLLNAKLTCPFTQRKSWRIISESCTRSQWTAGKIDIDQIWQIGLTRVAHCVDSHRSQQPRRMGAPTISESKKKWGDRYHGALNQEELGGWRTLSPKIFSEIQPSFLLGLLRTEPPMWHWDQGHLAYFQFDALRQISVWF